MPPLQWAMTAAVSMLPVILSACSDGGGIASALPPAPAPTPAPTPSSTPSPTPAPRASLVAPAQTANPASPVASTGGASFSNLAASTTFPLLQVAVDTNFGGDQATTIQGATLTVDREANRRGLTLNNEALGVVDATTSNVGNDLHLPGAPIPGGRVLQVPQDTLDYTVYGYWLIFVPQQNGLEYANAGAWLGGYLTPAGAVPVTGSANYSGGIIGLYDEGSASKAIVLGDIHVAADFATRSMTGTMTNIRLGSDTFVYGPMNDFAFSASLDPAQNLFQGTTRATSFPDRSYAFSTSAAGTITGRFFGPTANEVGGVWTLSDASHRLIASFGAKQ